MKKLITFHFSLEWKIILINTAYIKLAMDILEKMIISKINYKSYLVGGFIIASINIKIRNHEKERYQLSCKFIKDIKNRGQIEKIFMDLNILNWI